MSNYNLSINVLKITGASLVNIKGKEKTKQCLIIPIEDSDLYVGEKGVHLNMQAIELKESKFGQSHFIKCEVDGERYKAMTEEERKQIPIVGSMKIREFQKQQVQATESVEFTSEGNDDLPFN